MSGGVQMSHRLVYGEKLEWDVCHWFDYNKHAKTNFRSQDTIQKEKLMASHVHGYVWLTTSSNDPSGYTNDGVNIFMFMDILCRRRNVINYSYLGKSYYEVSVSPVIYWDKHLVNILACHGNIFQREIHWAWLCSLSSSRRKVATIFQFLATSIHLYLKQLLTRLFCQQ